jgi:formate-dependent nitrite reductase membrane component NrfD
VLGAVVAGVSVLLPDWPGRAPSLWRALQAVTVATAFGTAVYTGILLRSMQYIPAWRPAVLPWLFLASALSTGSMGVVLGAVAYGASSGDAGSARELIRGLEKTEPLVLVAEAALLAVYVRRLRHGGPAALLSAKALLTGRRRTGFWGGIVGLALALPFALVLANVGLDSTAVAVVAALSVLAGGFALRCGVLAVGVTEAPPLYRLARWRADRPVPTAGTRAPAGVAE